MTLEFDLRLSELEFYSALRARIRETGEVGDVFPDMVAYNVPLFALQELWPEERANLLASGKFPALCVAEHGWRGRIDNVHASLDVTERVLQFEKSYVMECDWMYIVARSAENVALCRVPRSAHQKWTSRADDSVRFVSTRGRGVDHYIVASQEQLTRDQFRVVPRRSYTAVGIQIPRREITGLAILSQGMMEHRGLGQNTAQKTLDLIHDRTDGPTKKGLTLAGEVFAEFQRSVPEKTRHPFWNRAAEFFSRA